MIRSGIQFDWRDGMYMKMAGRYAATLLVATMFLQSMPLRLGSHLAPGIHHHLVQNVLECEQERSRHDGL